MSQLDKLYAQLIPLLIQWRDKLMGMPATPQTLLQEFCYAIRDYEGGPNDANYKNNNPGNCRYFDGGYLPKYRPVKRSIAGFAIFPSMAIGFLYLENLVREKISAHPSWTILQFFQNYAPESDGNNSSLYAQFVAKRLQVDYQNYSVSNLL